MIQIGFGEVQSFTTEIHDYHKTSLLISKVTVIYKHISYSLPYPLNYSSIPFIMTGLLGLARTYSLYIPVDRSLTLNSKTARILVKTK